MGTTWVMTSSLESYTAEVGFSEVKVRGQMDQMILTQERDLNGSLTPINHMFSMHAC